MGAVKITQEIRNSILEELKLGLIKDKDIAIKYGVCHATISKIKHGKDRVIPEEKRQNRIPDSLLSEWDNVHVLGMLLRNEQAKIIETKGKKHTTWKDGRDITKKEIEDILFKGKETYGL